MILTKEHKQVLQTTYEVNIQKHRGVRFSKVKGCPMVDLVSSLLDAGLIHSDPEGLIWITAIGVDAIIDPDSLPIMEV